MVTGTKQVSNIYSVSSFSSFVSMFFSLLYRQSARQARPAGRKNAAGEGTAARPLSTEEAYGAKE
jgi:hypothetical protein